MTSHTHLDHKLDPPSRSLEGAHATWIRRDVFPPIATAPQLNRTSMVARPWRRFNLFASLGRKASNAREAGQERRRVARTGRSAELVEWQRDGRVRRIVLLALTLVQTAVAGALMMESLPAHGGTLLERLVLVLFLILFFWVSAGFWTAMAGFLVLVKGDRHGVGNFSNASPGQTAVQGRHDVAPLKTAIVMPICNEDVARVFAGLRATYESVGKTEQAGQFDFFILSDSSDTDICTAELDAWASLCRAVGGFGNIFYRRRKLRLKRKNGNIADFCRRWGKNYRYMVVLDADSVMTGQCLTSLADLMENNPNAGIIQTAPRVAGRETLYARIQQFASRVYGPLYTAGLHFWQLGESHYWGHNAIIRVAPFTRHCALAPLPGTGPLSGEILSHDFIEAALMRRAGWTVWIAYDLPGSYEEMPPNLLDELQRDRRWCRGNMMNFRLILEHGIHPVYRAVLATGLMAYFSSFLWLSFLVLSTILLAAQQIVPAGALHDLMATNRLSAHVPSPAWPAALHPYHAMHLFAFTTGLLILPKVLAIARLCRQGAHEFGGAVRLVASMALELLFSILSAPTRMLFHSRFVVEALTGHALHWKSPARGDAETTWGEAWQRHGAHTLLGVLWGMLVYSINPGFLVWMLPVVGALVLSIPLSVLSSRVSLGNRLRRLKLFLIPEEGRPPEELRATETYHAAAKPLPGFLDAVVDPAINALVCACGQQGARLSERIRTSRQRLLQAALCQGPAGLSPHEKTRLLNDPLTLFQLHRHVWEASIVHPHWHEMGNGRGA
jgi:membrane glycosyltransferase